MVNYREILRLSALKHVQRDVCSAIHCSDHTVRAVLKEAAKHNIHWPLDKDITNAELERILFPDKYQKISTYVEPDYPYIHRELAKPGVTLTLLWEEYCRKCYEGGRTPYMSTQFGDKYRKWARVTKATAFSINREMQSRLTGPEIPSRYMTRLLAHRVRLICSWRCSRAAVMSMQRPATT